jgi:hypothetical protein
MTRESLRSLPLSTLGLMLALVISEALTYAQSNSPGALATPSIQYLPNLGQQITPQAPQGSRFEPLNAGLVDKNAPYLAGWLAGQAASTVVSPDHKTLLVLTSGYNRVYTTAPSLPYPWNAPDMK